jgi:hypothetical protein
MRLTSGRLIYLLAFASVGALASSADAQTRAAEPGAGPLPPVTITEPQTVPKKRVQRAQPVAKVRSARRTQSVRASGQKPAAHSPSAAQVTTPGRGDVSSAVTALPAETTVLDAAAINRLVTHNAEVALFCGARPRNAAEFRATARED